MTHLLAFVNLVACFHWRYNPQKQILAENEDPVPTRKPFGSKSALGPPYTEKKRRAKNSAAKVLPTKSLR